MVKDSIGQDVQIGDKIAFPTSKYSELKVREVLDISKSNRPIVHKYTQEFLNNMRIANTINIYIESSKNCLRPAFIKVPNHIKEGLL